MNESGFAPDEPVGYCIESGANAILTAHAGENGPALRQGINLTFGIGSGADDAEPALPLFHPKPPVADCSLLPAKEQDVIVNVDISSVGEVIDETLVQGLGNPVDQIVLETIRGWHFRPATLNGTAVASAQKIVIPMSRDLTPDAS